MAAVFISAAIKSPYFSEILAFASPLIGVVLAFYFTARSSPDHRTTAQVRPSPAIELGSGSSRALAAQ